MIDLPIQISYNFQPDYFLSRFWHNFYQKFRQNLL